MVRWLWDWYNLYNANSEFTGKKAFLPEAIFYLWVWSLPASVCVCVCPCVCLSNCLCVNHKLVPTQTLHLFKLEESPNLDQKCKTPWLRSYCFGGWLTLTFKVKFHLEVKTSLCLVCPPKWTHKAMIELHLPGLLHSHDRFVVSILSTYLPTASWFRLFHSLSPLHIYWSGQPRVFPHLTSLLLHWYSLQEILFAIFNGQKMDPIWYRLAYTKSLTVRENIFNSINPLMCLNYCNVVGPFQTWSILSKMFTTDRQ